jgi:predicted chitinase/LAS superfamily LD-carboxypeptidase LdcB
MSYTIVEKNKQTFVEGKTLNGIKFSFLKENIDLLISACKENKFNKYLIAAILATVAKESGFKVISESLNFTPTSLIAQFPSYFKGPNRPNPEDYGRMNNIPLTEQQQAKIANYIYGGEYKNNVYKKGRIGNINDPDGWNFRGKGLNQITFKANYDKYGKAIGIDLVNNPEKILEPNIASKVAIEFYKDTFKVFSKNIKKNYNIDNPYNIQDWDLALSVIVNLTADGGFAPNAQTVVYNLEKARNYHKVLINYLEGNPNGSTGIESYFENTTNETNLPQDFLLQDTNEQESNIFSSDEKNYNDSSFSPIRLTQLFKPTIKPLEIELETDLNKNQKKQIKRGLGIAPLIYYNGMHIEVKEILSFDLYYEGMIPAIKLVIKDGKGIFTSSGFPLDDTIVTIFISSKSRILRSIYMDFKISDFKDLGSQEYSISGIADIPELYIREYISFSNKTSFETLQEISKICGLGFCSNINETKDKMTWINPDVAYHQFINNITQTAYVSDNSFVICYIDFYYNLCFVEIEKELNRDVKNDKMILSSGFGDVNEDPNLDEKVGNLFLTTDKSAKDSNIYIKEYSVINQSTKLSIKKSYTTKTKFYDTSNKEILIFEIDALTSNGEKSVILKGKPGDSDIFKRNKNGVWMGKIEPYDEGLGNMHKNFNYTQIQNKENLNEISKIILNVSLPVPNYNLYKYQKITVYILFDKPSLFGSLKHERLTGDWLIVDINIIFDGNETTQEIKLVKRELELNDTEFSQTTKKKKKNFTDNNYSHENELSPFDERFETFDSIELDSDLIEPRPITEFDLDYIENHSMKDNNGRIRRLVVIDGAAVDENVAIAFLTMQKDAAKDSINFSINSGFRPAFGPNYTGKTKKGKKVSITTQESLRRNKNSWVKSVRAQYKSDEDFVFNAPSSGYSPLTAKPGSSNHGNGIALDLSTGSRVSFSKVLRNNVYIWLIRNSWKYGFIRTVTTEEWHFEYRPDVAKKGPYSVISNKGQSKGDANNLFYADLGLNNLNLT